MKRALLSIIMLVLVAASVTACGGDNVAPSTPTTANNPAQNNSVGNTNVQNNSVQGEHITVQHILIGFKDAIGFQGQVPPKAANRTQEQAKALAYDLLTKAKGGADFDALVRDNTDDSPPGIYSMSDTGVTPAKGEYPREGMVPAFGNVGFTLKPGEIGIADYDPQTSPYGYHIIKRLR